MTNQTHVRTIRVAFFVDEEDGKTFHSVTMWTTPSLQGPYPMPLDQLQELEHRNKGLPLGLNTMLGINDTDGKTKEDLERAVGRVVMNLAAEVNGLKYDPVPPITLVPEETDGEDRS